MSNVSSDLIWYLTQNQSKYIVKRKSFGGEFSSDPLNINNLNTRGSSGLVNKKAVGINYCHKTDKIVLAVKTKSVNANKPAKAYTKSVFKVSKPPRKVAKSVFSVVNKYKPSSALLAVSKATAITHARSSRKKYSPKKRATKKSL